MTRTLAILRLLFVLIAIGAAVLAWQSTLAINGHAGWDTVELIGIAAVALLCSLLARGRRL